jgi:3-deoxy-D-manno-octulosonic-acid transferase
VYFIYSTIFGAWLLFMSPFFLYNALVKRKYLPSMRERMGYLPDSLKKDERLTIWIHACSVGEALSVQPLAHLLSKRFPEARLIFSVVTRSGRRIAEERFAQYGKGNVFYVPIDFPPFVNRVLDIAKPDMLVTIDTEIWPNIIHACRKRGVPVVMANGRISAQSFQYYQWVQPLMGPVLKNYVRFLMKDQEDADRLRRMGALASKVFVTGNLKYDRDVVEKDVAATVRTAIDDALGLSSISAPIILAGSTHEGEETILFDVLKRLRQRYETQDVRLLLVPRHPERFNTAASLAESSGLSVARRSVGSPSNDAAVLLLDSVGELAASYHFATIAFVGGSLIPHGGQSIMEPALYAKAIVVGPHTENFPGIIDDFLEHKALIQIGADEKDRDAQIEQLTAAFTKLLSDEAERVAMGERAQALFAKSKGATALTVKYIAEILEPNK